jgi:monovalent cation/proton antiporter MnhG/PhaG subunit
MSILSSLLIGAGVVFMAISVLGLFRLPDLYARAHGVAKSETFGLVLVFAGLLVRPGVDAPSAVRLLLVLVFALLANPTAVHALVRAAFRSGALPQTLTDQAIADAALREDGLRHEHGGDAR